MVQNFNLGLSKDSWDNITELLVKKNKMKDGGEHGLLYKNKAKPMGKKSGGMMNSRTIAKKYFKGGMV